MAPLTRLTGNCPKLNKITSGHWLRQALASPSPQAAASLLNNLATIQQSRRDFKSAHALLQQGLTLLNENKLDRSNIAAPLLANLALNLKNLAN